ncbi:hypothetical protein [Clavibacter tessellarius]
MARPSGGVPPPLLAVSAALLGAMASWILGDGAEALLSSDVGATLAGE